MKITKAHLQKIIHDVILEHRKPKSSRSMLSTFLFEETKEESAEGEKEVVDVGEPKGTAFDNQLNFKGADAKEVAAQILTRDPEQPIFKAMEFTDKGDDGEETVVKPDPDKVADWLEELGTGTFIKRVEAVGSKIPGSGLPKSKMPFLPGPKDATGDVKDVADALTPGGKYNIDIAEPFKEAAWKQGLHYLVERDAPAPNAFLGMDAPGAEEFMTAGLGANDGEDSDDSIEIKLGGGMAAQKAVPTQTNILLPKALGMAVNGVSGGNLKAYASLDDEILDGHHRWAATMLNDPSADIKTIAKVDLKKLGTDKTLEYLTAIGNALGNKTKTESYNLRPEDVIILERWQKLSGLMKG